VPLNLGNVTEAYRATGYGRSNFGSATAVGISPRNTASHEGVRAVVHRDVPMSPVPRLSVLIDCELREFDWRSHRETNAGFSR
jgi:hypothetical protein